jgi:hypothetical protein
MATDRKNTPRTNPSWVEHFEAKSRVGLFGDLSEFDELPETYCGDADAPLRAVAEQENEAQLLLPGTTGQVKLLHHCRAVKDGSHILGILGTARYSPFKLATAKMIIRPMTARTTRGSDMMIPSRKDFLSCGSADEFKQLAGTGTNGSSVSQEFHSHSGSTLI